MCPAPAISGGRGSRPAAPAAAFGMLLFCWFLFITSASFWLPDNGGDLGARGELAGVLGTLYALVAVLAAIGVRRRADSVREAVLSTLPVLALLVVAAAGGYFRVKQTTDLRGEPLFLYFGIALWASWAALLLVSALVTRAKWNAPAGLVATLIVALVGLFQVVARID